MTVEYHDIDFDKQFDFCENLPYSLWNGLEVQGFESVSECKASGQQVSPFAPRKLRIRCFRGAKGDS